MTGPSMADRPRPIRIAADPAGAQVRIGDTDISAGLQGFNLEQRVGQIPLLVLYANATGGAILDGVAHVVVGDEQDPGQQIAAFLSNIDPAALHQAALNRDDLDGSKHEITRAILAQLADCAQGRT
ncbi:hypothetical protein AB0L71_28000 [Streptomyces sp. NPDC052052]|uniref:hypothetical protein n=1 Tax=Streptomyces sp. NPDC052052 TaxID=3154756 RepID=UPI00343A2154